MKKFSIVLLCLLICSIALAVKRDHPYFNPHNNNIDIIMGSGVTIDGVDVSQVQIDTTTNRTDIDDNKDEIDELHLSTANQRALIDSNKSEIDELHLSTASIQSELTTYKTTVLNSTAPYATSMRVSTSAIQDGVDDNKNSIEGLASSTVELYYTNEIPTSAGYYLVLIDTPPSGVESTITSTIDSATVIIASFTTQTPLNLDAFLQGLYHSHFHAKVDNATKDTRLRAEVWKGTGSAVSFIFSTVQSNLLTTNKTYFDVHTTTNEIVGHVGLFEIRIVADTSGGGPDPVVTFYMEGDNASVFEMPTLSKDSEVTRIIEGTNTNVTGTGSTSGRGEVTVNVDSTPTFDSVLVGLDVEGTGDPNTKMRFTTDNLSLEAGGKKIIQGIEATIDMIFLGDGTWAYLVIGDTTTQPICISTYNYTTKCWSMPFGVDAASFTANYQISVDTITSNNNDHIQLMKPTTYYGSQWGRGHDSKGWDNIDAQSFTTDGSPISGGSTKLSIFHDASEFWPVSTALNNGSVIPKQWLMDGTTKGALIIRLTDAGVNTVTTQGQMPRNWDGNDFDFYMRITSSATFVSPGNTIINVNLSTSTPNVETVYGTTTTQNTSAWSDGGVHYATGTVDASAVGLQAGVDYNLQLEGVNGDAHTGNDYIMHVEFYITTDE